MMKEKIFENKIKHYIKDVLGGWYVKFFANSYTKSGIPDLLCCINGHFVAIEVKAQNGKPSELQLYEIEKIRKSYGFAFVVYPSGWEQLKKFLDKLNKGNYSDINELPIILNKGGNSMELDNKKYVIDHLLETKREGIEDLIDYMDEIGFFHAPCSSSYHLCCEFGLVQHTRNVMTAAENIGYHLLGKKEYEKIRNSVTIAAALHDLGKCGQFGKPLYVPNILKSGEQSDKKPYEQNKDLMTLPHEVVSVIEATKFIDLTEEEQRAIAWHNGLYGCFKYDIQGKETILYMIIHFADMWASRVMEVKE